MIRCKFNWIWEIWSSLNYKERDWFSFLAPGEYWQKSSAYFLDIKTAIFSSWPLTSTPLKKKIWLKFLKSLENYIGKLRELLKKIWELMESCRWFFLIILYYSIILHENWHCKLMKLLSNLNKNLSPNDGRIWHCSSLINWQKIFSKEGI